jgi:hypothetical protein
MVTAGIRKVKIQGAKVKRDKSEKPELRCYIHLQNPKK